MSIDTKQKRSAVFELPGLMMNPFPGGTNFVANRQQISDIYPFQPISLPIGLPSETCWIESAANISPWLKSSSIASLWKKPGSSSNVWTKEKEVVPCQD